LKELGIIRGAGTAAARLVNGTLSTGNLAAIADGYRERQNTDRDKLDQMMRYGQSAECRWSLLLEYFGESPAGPCGTCDNCRNPLAAQIA